MELTWCVNTTAGYICFIAMGSAMKCYTSRGCGTFVRSRWNTRWYW